MERIVKNPFIIFLLLLSFLGCDNSTKKNNPEFWVWMHADAKKTEMDWNADFDKLYKAGFTGVLIGSNIEVLKIAVPEAKKHKLEIHSWMWTMNRGDADSSWLSVNQLGKSLAEEKAYVNYYKFMCPALPEVKIFLKSKIDELAAIEGLDGIHMDYIRYVDAILPIGLQPKYGLKQDSVFPEFDYGYHPYMVDLYKQKTNIDPFNLPNPAADAEWLQFRLKELNKTVWELRDHIRNQELEATAAVFPTPTMAREMVRQEWNLWYLDKYFPMVYHNFYNEDASWIKKVVEENKSVVKPGEPIICGLYLPGFQSTNEIKQAIDSALAGGADGIAFFEYNSINKDIIETIKRY